MADEKQLSAVRFFCKKPFSDNSSKKSKRPRHHNWSDLVQQISYFDFGHTQKDEAIVQSVDRIIRKKFPNDQDWDRTIVTPGVHEQILAIIRSGLSDAGAE